MLDAVACCTFVTLVSLIQETKGNNFTITTTDNTEKYPKVALTVGIILFAVITAAIVAKLANNCHDREVHEDDISHLSDKTRKIIQHRLLLISKQRRARRISNIGQKFFNIWSKTTNASLVNDPNEKSTVINVEEKLKDTKNEKSAGNLSIASSNKLEQRPETQIKEENTNTKRNGDISNEDNNSPSKTYPQSPSSQNKGSPKSQSVKRQDSFVGPNVSRSDSIPKASPPVKRRDVTSATAVSINLSNSVNKTKKSVTFEDQVKNISDSPTKSTDTNGTMEST